MAAHTRGINGKIENTIFKQREEINSRMNEMFKLLKELMTTRTPEKVLIREEAKFPITKNMNSISLTKREEERSNKTEVTPDNTEKPTETKTEMPVKEAETKNESKNGAKNKSIKTPENEEAVEAPEFPDVNVMPYSTYMKLTDERPAETDIRLSLASHSYQGKSEIEAFHLEQPILIPDPPCMTDKGVKNDIEPIAPTMTVNRLVLEWEERIRLYQEKEMEFDQWRSKNFKDKHPSLPEVEEEVDDEGEVT
ncbi:hypothetical protein Tco_1464848 [Tanacetum coccineum]